MRRCLLVLLMLAAAPAGAVWGPSVGGQYFQPGQASPGQASAESMLGWEVGLAAFGPETQGFWHFNYGQARDKTKTLKLTSMAARLNFRLTSGKSAMIYAGGGIAQDRIVGGVTRKAWVESIQAGLLVSAAGLAAASGPVRNAGVAAPSGPGTTKTVNVGIEGGYRFGPKGFGGMDARLFLLFAL